MAQLPSIRILKPGTFTDVHGTKVTFTQADLDDLIGSYDAAADPAPVVVGHPKMDAPAFGWIGSLAMEDGHVVARPSDLAPAFAEALKARHYRKVSPQLYPPASPANPKPGRWYLQHVGFLGAAPPAIKGMGTYAFSADAEGAAITLSFTETDMDTPTDETAGAIALAERTAALDAREQELAAREARIEQDARDARHAANVAFAEAMIGQVRLAPAGRDTVVGLLDQLDALQPVAFGEGEAIAPAAAFRALLDTAHPVVALGEHAPADVPGPAVVTVSFAAPPGYTVDAGQAALHARAREIQATEPGTSFWDAVTRARTEPAA